MIEFKDLNVTGANRLPIYVNPSQVVGVAADSVTSTTLYMADGSHWVARLPLESVIKVLTGLP